MLKETGKFIITIQNIDGEKLPEIGYHIHKKYWRQGYAKEAAKAVRDWAFEKEYPDEVNKITHVSVIHRTTKRQS